MDRYLLDRYSHEFAGRSLRMNPFLNDRIGLLEKTSIIKMGSYFLYCVPYDMRLDRCFVLCVLKPGEIDLFSKLKDKPQTFHLEFRNQLFAKKIALFLRCSIVSMKPIREGSDQCKVEVAFRAVPNDYREILVDAFLHLDRCAAAGKDDAFRQCSVDVRGLDRIRIKRKAVLQVGSRRPRVVQLAKVAAGRIIVFTGKTPNMPKPGETAQVTAYKERLSFSFRGRIGHSQAHPQNSVLFFLEILPEFSLPLVDALLSAIPYEAGGAAEDRAADQADQEEMSQV